MGHSWLLKIICIIILFFPCFEHRWYHGIDREITPCAGFSLYVWSYIRITNFSNERDGREEAGPLRWKNIPVIQEQNRPIVSTITALHCIRLTTFLILTASSSSSTDHDSSELLWDDEFNQNDDDLFGTDHSNEGDYDESVISGGVYGWVS